MPFFPELAAAFLAEEYADSPVKASHLGVDGHDDRLDDLRQEMSQVEAALFRAARIVVDTS